jgi:hypothetical protein
MKRISIIVWLCTVAFMSNGQHMQGTLVASLSGVDRIELVKTSMEIPSWEEKTFWPIYEAYMAAGEKPASSINRSLADLSTINTSVADAEALQYVQNLFAFRAEKLTVFKKYYQEMGSELNGIIALQFLQTETLLQMMEESQVYDQSTLRRFRFHPKAVKAANFQNAKRNMMTNFIGIPEDKKEIFWTVYGRYQEDCDAMLGENYDMVAQFAGPADEYTPALAKRLGLNILNILNRENKLKEKYFNELVRETDAILAARFIAWEDYYSLVCKMHAWADAP